MTPEQIEKLIKVGERKKFNATQLAQYVTQPPYNLCAADATTIMYAFRRKHPPIPWAEPVKSGPVAQVAKVVTTNPTESNYTQSILNRSAVKVFALEVSRVKKAGKFKRVSSQFVQSVESDVEAFIRAIGPADDREVPGVVDFLNRKAIRPKVEEKLNDAIRKIIIRKVCANNIGKTLK